jgi:hypothetical protein
MLYNYYWIRVRDFEDLFLVQAGTWQLWCPYKCNEVMESWIHIPSYQPFVHKRGLFNPHALTTRPSSRRRALARIFQVSVLNTKGVTGIFWRLTCSCQHDCHMSSILSPRWMVSNRWGEVTLRLMVSQSVSQYVLVSSTLWDLRPDITSFGYVWGCDKCS